MAARLRLARGAGLRLDVPAAGPDRCETCRTRPPTAGAYCGRLCALFDAALGELAAALRAADDDRTAPAVVLARTRLRAVAAVHDLAELAGGAASSTDRTLAADWAEDVAAGELLPVRYLDAIAAVRAALDR